uniref:NADH-ubiquinone oxidoreductase chain 2 n=1 Tax=Cucujoidea sp. 41 KM-2017 TaxID=2219380 RepID=A0A346RHW4_9CUCU|nr:NADH dehydrogenase subunit 2 [Cucujoidea sp. 41 KM-2017]
MLFFNTLIMGTMLAISSYSWFSMWMGLEINLLSIIPLISKNNNIYPAESAMKYFLTQSMASVILLFAIILSLNLFDTIKTDLNHPVTMVLNSALFMKMGAAPFHFWFPEIMEGLNWMNCLIMLTWQKIAPMVILMYNIKLSLFISIIIISSNFIGSIMSLNQISLRKILAYSSINHIGWMLSSMLVSQYIWSLYFLIYSIISMNIIFIFNSFNIFMLKQTFYTLNKNKTLKILLSFNFISLGGLPPFLGFFPKWMTINFLVEKKFIFLSLIMIILTLITLFVYLRVIFHSLTINMNEILTSYKLKINLLPLIFNFCSLSLLTLSPLILNLT